MKKRTFLTSLMLFTFSVVHYRRSLLARLLKLPPPRYTVGVQRDIAVPMPDGVRLLADHYFPQAKGDFPTILIRTPYGRAEEIGFGGAVSEFPAQRFAERGYHVIIEGARGCFDSEGEFSPHVNEAADGQATVDWMMQQPWFNGILGTWGASYMGYMQWATAAEAPSCLKAMVPMVTSAGNLTSTHPDGAFALESRLRWSQSLYFLHKTDERPIWKKLIDRYFGQQARNLQAALNHLPLLEADTVAVGEAIPFYRDLLSHKQADDPFWIARDHTEAVAEVTAPVHFIGGWYDYYLRGLLRDYTTLKEASSRPYLTIGPWYHAHLSGMMTGLREGLTWLDAHLKGYHHHLRHKPVRIYVMGAKEWREFHDFPPPARQMRYYLHSAALTTKPAAAISSPDCYRYDPANPTPAVGGALLAFQGAGAQDNRLLEARADVLCYSTAPLTEALEIIGTVRLLLFVRSSLSFTDFFGRLCDVSPSGRSTNICDGLLRLEPGKGEAQPDGSLRIEIEMWPTAYRFRQGHRLRLQVSSGAHPRWSRNLGTGEPLATGTRMAIAEQTIYHDEEHPSALLLPVTKGG
jgi:putative CocE/NonD family hydrolase